MLADPGALRTENARDFLAWEARGGDPVCIEPTVADPGSPTPAGIRYVVTTEGEREPPFAGLTETRANGPYTVWEVRGRVRGDPPEGER